MPTSISAVDSDSAIPLRPLPSSTTLEDDDTQNGDPPSDIINTSGGSANTNARRQVNDQENDLVKRFGGICSLNALPVLLREATRRALSYIRAPIHFWGGIISLGRSFLKVITSLTRTTLILGCVIGLVACVYAYMGFSLARWEARKDYLEDCRNNLEEKSPDMQSECLRQLAIGLGPPPYMFLSGSKRDTAGAFVRFFARAIHTSGPKEELPHLERLTSRQADVVTQTPTSPSLPYVSILTWFLFPATAFLVVVSVILVVFLRLLPPTLSQLRINKDVARVADLVWRVIPLLTAAFVLTSLLGSMSLYRNVLQSAQVSAEKDFLEYCKAILEFDHPDYWPCQAAQVAAVNEETNTAANSFALTIEERLAIGMGVFALVFSLCSTAVIIHRSYKPRQALRQYHESLAHGTSRPRYVPGRVFMDLPDLDRHRTLPP